MRQIKKIGCLSLLGILPLVGYANEGQDIYERGGSQPAALACKTCHGLAKKDKAIAGYPDVSGMPAAYLSKQLYDFQENLRNHAVMDLIANALDDDEIEAVTMYMASLPRDESDVSIPMITRADKPTDIGSQLALRGDWSRQIPECIACHGPSGVGVGESFPRIGRQGATYIANQLTAWKKGTRHNDQADLMGHIAQSLTDEEIKAVSVYFSTVGEEK